MHPSYRPCEPPAPTARESAGRGRDDRKTNSALLMRKNRERLEEKSEMNGFGDFLSLGARGLEDDAFGDVEAGKRQLGNVDKDIHMFIHGF